jgi:xanthine dehydrogenase accessory factor
LYFGKSGEEAVSDLPRIITFWEFGTKTRTKMALCTVVRVTGSHYRKPGAKMLVAESGAAEGSVSGGCLESDLRIHAAEVLRTNLPKLVRYDTNSDGDVIVGTQTGCGGIVDILIEPTATTSAEKYLAILKQSLHRRDTAVIGTVYQTSGSTCVRRCDRFFALADGTIDKGPCDSSLIKAIAGNLTAVFSARKSADYVHVALDGQASVLLEYVAPPVSIVFFGAGDDAIPVHKLASELGWHVTVVDSRTACITPARFGGATLRAAEPHTYAATISADAFDAAVIMTHNYERDLELLRQLLPRQLRYIGLLGSRRRTERLLHDIAISKPCIAKESLERLYAPVGLDIGADGPHEIAIAVIAEIIAALSGRSGQPLRNARRGKADDVPVPFVESDDWS